MLRMKSETLKKVLEIVEPEAIKFEDGELILPLKKGTVQTWSDSEDWVNLSLNIQLSTEKFLQLLKFLRAL